MNPNLANILQPGAINVAPNDALSQPKSDSNGFLNFILPTGGAILGGALGGVAFPTGGEIGGGAAGMAGGQALADLLEGKKPGWDVPIAGGAGLVGGALGDLLGNAVAKTATGVSDDLVTGGLNLTKSQLAKFATENGVKATDLLVDNGMAGVNADTLESGIGKLGKMYGDIATSDAPVSSDTFLDNATTAIEKLRSEAPGSSKAMADKIEQEIQDNVLPKIDSDTTMADLQKLKTEYDGQTTDAQFNADPEKWNVNRSVGNILRKTLNDSADENGLQAANGQPLSELGKTMQKLTDLSDLAQKRAGVSSAGNLFGPTNEILGGVGITAAKSLGAAPGAGLLLPGMRIAYSAIRANPMLADVLSGAAGAVGQGVAESIPALEMAGILGGGALAKNLTGTPVGSEQNNENNNEQNSQLSPILAAGATNGNVAQTNTDVNNPASNPQLSPILNAGSNVQGQGVPSFDGKVMFPTQLPPASALSNSIPGQIYPLDQQEQDAAYIENIIKSNPGSPLAMQYAQTLQSAYGAKKAINDQIVNQYVQQHGLSSDEKAFMDTAPVDYQNLNTLRSLVQQNGASDIIQAYLNDNETYLTARERADPTGSVGLMVNLMGQLKLKAARAGTGGAAPSPFDLALQQAFSPGQTVAENLRNLDHVQSVLLQQWQQYAPVYGLTSGQGTTQPPLVGNDTIDAALHAVATGQ